MKKLHSSEDTTEGVKIQVKKWENIFFKGFISKVKVEVTQSYLTLCDPMDYTVQARILEWVAFLFSRGSSQPRDQTQVSHIAGRFFTT